MSAWSCPSHWPFCVGKITHLEHVKHLLSRDILLNLRGHVQMKGIRPWNYAIPWKDNKMVRRKYSLNSYSRDHLIVLCMVVRLVVQVLKVTVMGKFRFLSLGWVPCTQMCLLDIPWRGNRDSIACSRLEILGIGEGERKKWKVRERALTRMSIFNVF